MNGGIQLLRLAHWAGQMDTAGPSTIGSVSLVQRPLILIIMYNINSSVTSRRSTTPDERFQRFEEAVHARYASERGH